MMSMVRSLVIYMISHPRKNNDMGFSHIAMRPIYKWCCVLIKTKVASYECSTNDIMSGMLSLVIDILLLVTCGKNHTATFLTF